MIDELERKLRKLDLSMKGKGSRILGTRFISTTIETVAQEYGLTFEAEAYIGVNRSDNGRSAIYDYILTGSNITYAIEIDASNKKWSLEKLIKARSIGYIPVWIRWHSKNTLAAPPEVCLIDLF